MVLQDKKLVVEVLRNHRPHFAWQAGICKCRCGVDCSGLEDLFSHQADMLSSAIRELQAREVVNLSNTLEDFDRQGADGEVGPYDTAVWLREQAVKMRDDNLGIENGDS